MPRFVEYAPAVIDVWGRPRIRVDGKDVTWFADERGHAHATVPVALTRQDPFTYGPGVLLFPGIGPTERPGMGRLEWLKEDAYVRVAIVGDGDTSEDDLEVLYRGTVTSFRHTPAGLEAICEGRVYMAGTQVVPPNIGLVEQEDLEAFVCRVLNGVRNRKWQPAVSTVPGRTGIPYSARGDMSSPLAMVVDALATGIKADGTTYTVRWEDDRNRPVFCEQEPRNTWTFTYGQRGLLADLTEDRRAVVHAIYGSGIAPNGGAWRNSKYPQSTEATPPVYPMGSTLYYPGDAMPASVGSPFWRRMRELGYRVESTATYYNPADRLDVIDLQSNSGIVDDASGSFGPQTWSAAFQPGKNARLGDAFILPLAAVPEWDEWIRNGDGSRRKKNPKHDPSLAPVERYVDFGDGHTKRAAARAARAMIRRESKPPIQGTLTITGDPREGHRLQIREGDRIKVLGWTGKDVTLYAAEVSYDLTTATVTLTVSSRRGPYVTIVDEIAQRRSERASRRESNGRMASVGQGVVWDAESPAGVIPAHSHYPRLGSVAFTPVPVFGSVVRTVIEAAEPCEMIITVWNKPVTPAQVEGIIGGNPWDLTGDPWEKKRKALRDAGLVIGWGTAEQPAGYGYELKNEGADMTGTFYEDAEWTFRIPKGEQPFLRVLIWPTSSAPISGRFYPAAVEV